MTREKQIEIAAAKDTKLCKAVSPRYGEAVEEGFIIGAIWADEHPKEGLVSIEKACDWIENNIFDFPWYDSEGEFSSKDVSNDFRKAMEE